MEHALAISLEDFDSIYTDVDWYGHDEEKLEYHSDYEEIEHRSNDEIEDDCIGA